MSRIGISPERYQAFLDAFLQLGNRPNAVAKRLGCEPATARKAWDRGWPETPYGAPIARVYAQALLRLETTKTAIEASKAPQTTQAGVESDESVRIGPDSSPHDVMTQRPQTAASILQQSAIDATQTEVDLLQAFRCNLIGAVSVSNKILRGFEALAIAATENAIVASQNVAQCTPDKLLRPLEKFSRIMTLLTTSTESVIKMQRLLVGAPSQITEQRGPTDAGELDERMQRARRILDQMQRSGLIPSDERAQPDLRPYEGEETHAPQLAPVETPDDSERDGNTVPTVAV